MQRRIQFALRRKSGYISPYSLGMIYPSYRKGVFYADRSAGYVAPIMVKLPLKTERWFRVPVGAVRFPSWVARKLRNADREGFVKR